MGVVLRIAFFILNVGSGFGSITVKQDSFVSGSTDSTVDLACHLKHEPERILRVNPYWTIDKLGQDKMYVYPPSSPSKESRVKLTDKDNLTDMSVSISNLKLDDTEIYSCHVSVLIGSESDPKSILTSGNGTMLFVHGPMRMELNDTEIRCSTQVRTVDNVNLAWKIGHTNVLFGDSSQSLTPGPGGTYWIVSRVTVKLDQCVGNVTVTCLLTHTAGHKITNESMAIPCRGSSPARQPVLLYSFLLGSPFLILLLIISVSMMKRRCTKPARANKVNIPKYSFI
ncbi:uncharacterized protein RCH25_008161 [Pelodytes ibericus]